MMAVLLLLLILLFSPGAMAQESRPVRAAVVLPLKENTARGAKMVEFYQGLLMAADSLKRAGLDLEITALHSGSTMNDMDQLLMAHSLRQMDVVFGPLDVPQQLPLADYCDIHGVRLVSPFSTLATQLADHPLYYMANAPRSTVQQQAIWFIQSHFPDHNIILADCNEQNEEGQAFAQALRDAMSEKGIYVRTLNVAGDEMAYYQAFNPLRKNLIVLNSSSLKALNAFLPRLKAYRREHADLSVSLFGYPAWQTYTAQLLPDFYEQDTYIYTPFYRNPLEPRAKQLDQSFLQWFRRPMQQTYPRYGVMGFDLGYYFLRGINIYGNRLEDSHQKVPARPYQHPFCFERAADGNGFVNTFVELIHYSPAQTIDLV
ncbi:MAG: hypothetical protein K6G70_00035, partial [Bacteroidaceae bacterium]|nr:hypothetical protein [Bacteroidaceae bacterium]